MKLEPKSSPAFKLQKIEKETKSEDKQESLCMEVAECVTEFMNAATSFHQLHLKVTGQGSYAAHNALSGYDKFHNFADDLAEGFQGAYGEILTFEQKLPISLNSPKEAISFLEELKKKVTYLQSKLPYSEIINQLDIVKEHCNGMKYKLLFLH